MIMGATGIKLDMHLWAYVLINVLFIPGRSSVELCAYEDDDGIIDCHCEGTAAFEPDNLGHRYLTDVSISLCTSLNLQLDHSTVVSPEYISNITVENITESLAFHSMPIAEHMGRFEIKNVGRIPLISLKMLNNTMSIDTLIIENTWIESFEETFHGFIINNLLFRNVTIERMVGMNLRGNGTSFKMMDTVIKNLTGNFNVGIYDSIELVNTSFAFEKRSEMSIIGLDVTFEKSTFDNVDVTITAKNSFSDASNCFGGKTTIISNLSYTYGEGCATDTINRPGKNNTDYIASGGIHSAGSESSSQRLRNVNLALVLTLIFILH